MPLSDAGGGESAWAGRGVVLKMKRSRREKEVDTVNDSPVSAMKGKGGEVEEGENMRRTRRRKREGEEGEETAQKRSSKKASEAPKPRRGERSGRPSSSSKADEEKESDGDEDVSEDQGAQETALIVAPSPAAAAGDAALDDGAGSEVVYIGHLPHGFYENELRGFFTQFGNVKNVKVSRSKRTARSKGYAFVAFDSAEVAEIACRAINGYIMFGQVLKCSIVKKKDVHPDLFKGCDKKFRAIPWQKIATEIHDKPLTATEQKTRNRRLLRDERKRQKRIADAGIAYEFEGYAAPKDGAAVEKPKPTKTKKLGTTKEAKAGSKRPAPRASRKKG